jgi:hypothetical protein
MFIYIVTIEKPRVEEKGEKGEENIVREHLDLTGE